MNEVPVIALAMMILGLLLLSYFLLKAYRNYKYEKAMGAFIPSYSQDRVDRETLKLLRDLEKKARDFDHYLSQKIFDEESQHESVASDEHWNVRSKNNDKASAPNQHLYLIKGGKNS